MDYLKDDEAPTPQPSAPVVPAAPGPQTPADDVDPLLAELLPTDRNVRRRVVSALLRGVLLEGGRSS